MAIMLISDYAGFVGLSFRQLQRIVKEGRLEGLTVLKPRIKVVNTETARILPPPNRTRRLTGGVIGRSKPLRGEEGFVEGQHKRKPK